MRQVLEADAAMFTEVRSMLASVPDVVVRQHVRVDRDVYVAGRDMNIGWTDE